MASELFLLAGDDVVLDLVVRRLRDDALADQLVLPLVGAILDDLPGVGIADPGQRLEVGLRGAVEIELLLPLALGLPGVVGLLRVSWPAPPSSSGSGPRAARCRARRGRTPG